jgi:hypothetical protein
MEGYKQVICTGDYGFPGRYGQKHFIPIDHNSPELKKGLKYWIPKDFINNMFSDIEIKPRGKKNE